MDKTNWINGLAVTAVFAFAAVGCNNWTDEHLKSSKYRFISPEKIVERPDEAEVNYIISAMGIEKDDSMFPNARRPQPSDWEYSASEYRLAPGDMIDVSVMGLYAEGVETTVRREVAENGYLDLPLLDVRIMAEGMTQMELVKAIEQGYSKNIIREPQVSVTILSRSKRTFSILGAVGRPGTYQITKKDMRMLDVMALCGGIYQNDIEYIYVIRQAQAIRKEDEVNKPKNAAPQPNEKTKKLQEVGDLMNGPVSRIKPVADVREVQNFAAVPGEAAAPASKSDVAGKQLAAAGPTDYQWKFVDNRWVKVPVGAETPAEKPAAGDDNKPALDMPTPKAQDATLAAPKKDMFNWADLEKSDLVEVIAVNRKELYRGDYRQNIVIHDNDNIYVPQIELGEFYLMGEVMRPGVYALTSKGITVKMAVAAAGNLGPMAWPENSIIIRRVGKNQEQMIPINIEKIFKGEDPDVYLKPNDILAVGTHWSSTFLAVIRNSFRMSYGFGFIYDRNFGDPYQPSLNSERFTHW